jgi:hypothetical protein
MKKESKRKSSEGNPQEGLRKVTILDKEEKR